MFVAYPMLIIFNYTSSVLKDVRITSTHPLWTYNCKKIKKNNNKSLGLGKYTQNGVTDIILNFTDDNGNIHEIIAIKDICMKGMPKVKIFVKDGPNETYIADFKTEY